MSRTFYAALSAGLLLGACGDEPPVIFSHSPQPSSEAGAGNISAAGGALSRTGAGASRARPGGGATASKGGSSAITGTGGTSGATTGAPGNANGGLAGVAGSAAAGGNAASAAGSSGNGTGAGRNAAGAAGTSDGGAHDAHAGHSGVDGGTDAGCSRALPEGVEPAPAKPPRCDDPPIKCPPGTMPYVSACGCGCQQGGDCPREVRCGGPGPSDPLCTDSNRCPYTTRRR